MKNSTLISLVRHGAVDNPKNLFYGRMTGYGLSDAGYAEAKRAARFLRKNSLTALFTSPLLRARQTAKEIAAHQDTHKIIMSRLLNEVNSPFEGWPMQEIEAQPGEIYASDDPRFDQPYDIFIKSQRFIVRTLRQYPGQHVAAVTHGDIILFTLFGFYGLPIKPESKKKFKAPGISDLYPTTGSITTLTYRTVSVSEKPVIHYSRPV